MKHLKGLVLPWSEREVFSIAPVIVGAGRGVGTILAGIALVAFAFITAGSSLAFSGLVLTSTATAATTSAAFAAYAGFAAGLGTLGLALIVGGVAQLISPMPSMGGLTSGKEAARLESFSFSGIVNTSKQGMAVPICYGRAFVGAAVISSGLDVDQVAV
jgi:predicted phage tail protein